MQRIHRPSTLPEIVRNRIDIAAAENKLRQADLLLGYLRSLPRKIARDMRSRPNGDYRLALETFFSACLGAARSSHYILWETGGQQFKKLESNWRNSTLDEKGRTRFKRMLKLRDDDVHYGVIDAETSPKMLAVDVDEGSHFHHNAALFGPQPMTEHENPDGIKVRAPALQGTVGLYIEIGDSRVEAANACCDFIEQLRSLLREAKAVEASKSAVASDEAGPD